MTEEQDDSSQTLVSHLLELKTRIVRALIAVAIVAACLMPFANEIYAYLAGPLTQHMPEGSSMIAIDVASPFLTPFKLALVVSIFIAMPVVLYQFWAFVAPGLYEHEKRLVFPLLFASSALFYLGIAFAYYVVFPLVFGFFTATGPQGVAVMTDISRYLDFVLTLFFAFGISFEVPIITIVLIRTGIVSAEQMRAMRPYIIVGAFIFGMILTPPDAVSQTLLAVPVWLLFELGLFSSKLLDTKAYNNKN